SYDSGTGTFSIDFTRANTWTGLQQFNGNASSTQFTTTGSTYLATTGGNVGVGTTTPGAKFSVQGNALFSGSVNAASLTATGTLSVAGQTTLATSLTGLLKATSGVVSIATAG